jgi:hypothetical protein
MKIISLPTALVFLLLACHHQERNIIQAGFIDSLIANYHQPGAIRSNEADSQFWKDRIKPGNPGLVNESRYAGQLATRFRLWGDIRDLKAADSILLSVDSVYNHKEASVFLAMVGHCLSQHRFREADVFLKKAKDLGIKPYESCIASFDVDFELGRYGEAIENLNKIRSSNDYGYFFRKAKWEHYKGNLDSAIGAMQSAYRWAGKDTGLQQAALSNAADLYLHAGELQEAAALYIKSVQLSGADIHSIMGLGWIALVHDRNDTLAEKLFRFVQTRTKLPDPLLKLADAAEERNDSISEKNFAVEFAAQATDSLYGNMYNKYLIDLFTGVLLDPARAELLSKKEIESRPTPQTYAWYVWCLFCNKKTGEAEGIYEKYVSGKPLEGLELYWMGKFMKGLQKGYNAREFFKAAEKNKYDLSPAKIQDLQKNLEE